MGTAIKHPVPDRVKQSFVIFDIRAPWRSALSVRVPGCQLYPYGNSGRQRVDCTTQAAKTCTDYDQLSVVTNSRRSIVTIRPQFAVECLRRSNQQGVGHFG